MTNKLLAQNAQSQIEIPERRLTFFERKEREGKRAKGSKNPIWTMI